MDTPTNRKVLYALLVTFVVVLAVGVNSVIYANSVANRSEKASQKAAAEALQQSEQAWCSIINLFDNTYTTQPPTTDAGKLLQKYFKNLKERYKC